MSEQLRLDGARPMPRVTATTDIGSVNSLRVELVLVEGGGQPEHETVRIVDVGRTKAISVDEAKRLVELLMRAVQASERRHARRTPR